MQYLPKLSHGVVLPFILPLYALRTSAQANITTTISIPTMCVTAVTPSHYGRGSLFLFGIPLNNQTFMQ